MSDSSKKYRYPGTRPFETDEKELFFGRSDDSEQLCRQILNEKTVLLYSRSGMGKSSLINAGLMPLLQQVDDYRIISIRFGNYNAQFEQYEKPLEKLFAQAGPEINPEANYLEKIIPNENSLWYRFKQQQRPDKNTTLLFIFDQFEELLTYPAEDIFFFKKQFAHLLFSDIPSNIRSVLDRKLGRDSNLLAETELQLLTTPLRTKALFAIRNDRMSELNRIADYFPNILKTFYELKPLNKNQAEEAIVEPAQSLSNAFASKPFLFRPGVVSKIIRRLEDDDTHTIEAFQLQMVCRYAEELVVQDRTHTKGEISEQDLGDIQSIFAENYRRILRDLTAEHQHAAQILIEEKLVVGGNRVPLPEIVILQQQGIPQQVLNQLLDSHFLRAELNSTGGRSIELSHDTLISPVTQAMEKRKVEEALRLEKDQAEKEALKQQQELEAARLEAETERRRAEEQALLRKEAVIVKDKARRNLHSAWFIAGVAVAVAVLAIFYYNKAQKETSKTQAALTRADSLNKKNEKLIDAFYFYDGKFALAYKDYRYGFINKDGDPVIRYQYDKAEQFDESGFAKVKLRRNGELIDYLIDTSNNRYRAAYNFKDLMNNNNVTALDLRGTKFQRFPSEMSSQTQLKVIIADRGPGNIYNLQIFPFDNLINLTHLSFQSCKIDSIPYKIQYLSTLKSLNVNSNKISYLPLWIGKLKGLTNLYLSFNQLSSLPEQIREFKSITNLYLNYNQLRSLPTQMGELKNLAHLDLFHNQLSSLPTQIRGLKSLTSMTLDYNQLSSLPAQIRELKNLTDLSLSGNKLSSLPAQIGELKNLKFLSVDNNQLSSLPTQLGELKSLTDLSLGSNQLSSLPAQIGELKSLTNLYLNHNQLSSLPAQIGKLKSLINLSLGGNKLSIFPAQIGELKSLKFLSVANNQLNSLPAQIGELKNLINLDLNDNKLSSVPAWIGELKNLTSLDLRYNQLGSLPAQIGELKNLTTLLLDGITLSSLPVQIKELKNVTVLSLSNNQLNALPVWIKELESLIVLYLNYNQLRSLPAQIGEIKNLTTLYLNHNQLNSLPARIGELKNLKFLSLEDNQLSSLPAQIGELKSLTDLHLNENQLSNLPIQMGELKSLSNLSLRSNRLTSLPEWIKELKNLSWLDLRGNPISKSEKKRLTALIPWCNIHY